jgi:NADPH2:quinone reductase
MSRRIVVRRHGGPKVLEMEALEPGRPGPGEVRVRHTAIGLNYVDTYYRAGLYPPPKGLPFTPGHEAAGVVDEVGPGVHLVAQGDRVAYGTGPLGAYSEMRTMPAGHLLRLPDEISDETAAAMMLKGMTAQYLLRQAHAVKPGETILVHAAAGGVGLIACQWARHLGATVIGTVGSKEKVDMARRHGCDHVILYQDENFALRVREITRGLGVPVVYDGVGKATFMQSLDCLQPRGLMVSFGSASGPVESFNTGVLAQKGSLYLTRPTLMTYTATRDELESTVGDLFDVVLKGAVTIEIHQCFRLEDAAAAHRALEARETTGSTILVP